MLNTVSVKTRLTILITVPIVAFIGLAIISLMMTKSLVMGIQSINNDRVVPLKQIKVVSDNYAVSIVDNLHKYNAKLLSKSQLLAAIESAENVANQNWQAYLNTELTSEEKRLIGVSESLFSKVKQKVNWYQNQIAMEQPLASSPEMFVKEMYDVFDPFSTSLNDLIDLQLNTSQQFTDDATENYESTQLSFIIACVLLLIATIVMALVIYKSIITPLRAIGSTMANIANNTDLTLRVSEYGNDEFSRTAVSINTMLNHFKSLIEELLNAVKTLSNESEQMSRSSSQVAATTEQQEHQTTMIATAITEMSAAIGEVASNAVTTSHKANESDDTAKHGLAKVQENIDSINQLNEVIRHTKEDIDLLSEKSNEINSVVQIIQNVAEQTNLLALNAAIEAARAGESGRGFAVVADEVRQLAHNTQKATEQISSMIIALQDASQRAVSSMEDASGKASHSVEIAAASASSIQSIAEAITEIADMNIVVSTSTEEQTTVAAEISQNINEFSDSIRSVTISASDMAQTGRTLSELSGKLNNDISIFKV
ncbi:methyl-accepting chemotaxis protein [Pseudoalteromonas spongiae]|uniref:methyl-accepting chemotaxis protein n=1 Tax=Pseudoalteromonas spongiae TaxID=298657 RepID=UPI00026CD9EB|nr:methyl-accepting chemotaxis protein [Pseudoalteromonas spongiae]ATD00185.1 methyl-accepting chemotaxis protein [Pseudoalteromonas spongiae UST010723-006]